MNIEYIIKNLDVIFDLYKMHLGVLFSNIESEYIKEQIKTINKFMESYYITNQIEGLHYRINNYKKVEQSLNNIVDCNIKNKEDKLKAIVLIYQLDLFFKTKLNIPYKMLFVFYNMMYKNNLDKIKKEIENNYYSTNKNIKLSNIIFDNKNNNIVTKLDLYKELTTIKNKYIVLKLDNNKLPFNLRYLAIKGTLKKGENRLLKLNYQNNFEYFVLRYLDFDNISNYLIIDECIYEELKHYFNSQNDYYELKYPLELYKDISLKLNHFELIKVIKNNVYSYNLVNKDKVYYKEVLKDFYMFRKYNNLKQYKSLLNKIEKSKYTFIDKEENIKDKEEQLKQLDLSYLDIINNSNENIIELFNEIEKYYIDLDNFKSNSLERETTTLNDYDLNNYYDYY